MRERPIPELDEFYDPLLDPLINPLAGLDWMELSEMLDAALEDLGDPGSETAILAPLLADQLEATGKQGRAELWRIVEQAEPNQLRALMIPLVRSERDRTRIRRFLFALMEDDDPLRVTAGISGFQYRRERKVLKRVLDFLEHPSPIVRAAAVSFHRAVAEWECLPTLVEAAKDPAPEVRQASMMCVLDLGVVATSNEVRQALDRVRGQYVKDMARDLLNGTRSMSDELIIVREEALEFEATLGREIRWRDVEEEERTYSDDDVTTDAYVALAIRDPGDLRLTRRIHELWQSDERWSRYIAVTTMTVTGDRTFESDILDLRDSDDELLSQAAYLYKRMQDPVGVLPELLALLRSGTPTNQMFAMLTLSGILANEADGEIRGWLETLTDDEDEAVRTLAQIALTPEFVRRFRGIELPEIEPYWTSLEPQ